MNYYNYIALPTSIFLGLILNRWQLNILFLYFHVYLQEQPQSYCLMCDNVFWISDSFVLYIYWHDLTQPWFYESRPLPPADPKSIITWLVCIRVVWLTWDHIKPLTACCFTYNKYGLHKSFATVINGNSYINCVSLTKQKLYMDPKTNMVRTAAGVCLSCLWNICLTFQVPRS